MKTFNKKLTLKKTTLVNLENEELQSANGGIVSVSVCAPCYSCWYSCDPKCKTLREPEC